MVYWMLLIFRKELTIRRRFAGQLRVTIRSAFNLEYADWQTFLGNKPLVEALLSRLRAAKSGGPCRRILEHCLQTREVIHVDVRQSMFAKQRAPLRFEVGLTGDEASIRRVTSAAGFTYQWDERTGQFAHVSGILVVTPEGRLSRYFYGVEYSPKELRLALVESGQGRIGSAIDELLLYCFHYDPESGRYGLVVMNLVRLGGVRTVLFMGGFILMMRRRESRPPAPGRVESRA